MKFPNSLRMVALFTFSDYLTPSDFVVLVTGSKFIGGAPFSGAVLIPRSYRSLFDKSQTSNFIESLNFYFSKGDIDPAMSNLADVGNAIPNFGMVVRWYSGLYELKEFVSHSFFIILISRYLKIPVEKRHKLFAKWRSHVISLLEKFPQLIPIDISPDMQLNNLPLANSVISFQVSAMFSSLVIKRQIVDATGSYLSRDRLRPIHRLLTKSLVLKDIVLPDAQVTVLHISNFLIEGIVSQTEDVNWSTSDSHSYSWRP